MYIMVVIFPTAVVLTFFAENMITAIMAVRQSQLVSLIYYQKRTAFITYQNKLEEMGDRLVYDYQVKGQYHV